MKSFKKPLALVLCLVLVMGLGTSALAVGSANGGLTDTAGKYTYTAPTYSVSVDDNVVTASAHRAASPVLGMMGVDAVSGFGMINGSDPTDLASAQAAPAVGIWGSDINDNPDPYYWNYFYNFYAAENGLNKSNDALINAAVSASPVQADTNLQAEFGNVSYSLSARPEILIGCSSKASGTDVSGYDDQLATIHSFTKDSPYYQDGDETYSPELVSYQTTRINDMINSVYGIADAITEVEKATGETTRYDDVQDIANDYAGYVYGTIGYIQSKIASGAIKEKTVAVLTSYDAATNTYLLANSTSVASTSLNRPYEYVMNVADTTTIGETYGTAKEVSTTSRGQTTTNTYYSVPAEALKNADAIVVIQGSIENAQDGTTSINRNTILESLGGSYDGIICAEIPAALYGMTMNSVENANGYGYIDSYIYSDVLPELNPVEMTAYFYQRFYHISDAASLQQTIINNFESVTLPEGSSTTLSSTYSAANIESILNTGIAYVQSNSAAYAADETATLIGLDNVKVTKMSGNATKAVTKTTPAQVVLTVYTQDYVGAATKTAKTYTAAELKAIAETGTANYAYSGKSGAKTLVATEYIPFAALLEDAGVEFAEEDVVNFTCTDGAYTKFIPSYAEITAATLGADGQAATPVLCLAYGETADTASACAQPKFAMALSAAQYEAGETLMGKCFPTDVTAVTITCTPFSDITANDWYSAAATYAAKKGISVGTGEGTFDGTATLNVAQMAQFLYAQAGSPNGSAKDGEDWYVPAQKWAIEKGYIEADEDILASCTRLKVVQMMYAAAGSEAVDTSTSPFTDCSDAAAVWAAAKGITLGDGDGHFMPTDVLNRAAAVQFIYNTVK